MKKREETERKHARASWTHNVNMKSKQSFV